MRLFSEVLSNLLIRKVLPFLENFSHLASGTFNLHKVANSCVTISQAPESNSSCLDGNFAIHKLPSGACTVAFGRAPPNEEPG